MTSKKKVTNEQTPNQSRRSFLLKSGAALAGAYMGFYVPRFTRMAPRATPTSNMQYRVLGSTGLKISDVGFGGFAVSDPNVVHHAIDNGVNYIDTAWDYRGGASEATIGKAIKNRRDEVIVTTKWHPYSKTTAKEMMTMLDTSLKRLNTDYVDTLLVHQVGKASGGEGVERLKNPELFKAMDMAKKQGKARFFGCSGHDGDLMEVMNYAITIPEFSHILCRINFNSYPTEPELFKKAQENGVGVVVMKTLQGSRNQNLNPYMQGNTTKKQAGLRWVLDQPNISGLVVSMSSTQQVDEYMMASGPLVN